MEKYFNIASVIAAAFGGVLMYLFGGWDVLIIALVSLIILDYISGIIKAVYQKKLSSEVGFKGICKKVMIMLVVALANILEHILGSEIGLREIVITFFIANEGISILENAAVLLPNMPKKMKDILLQLRDKDGGNNENLH